MQRFLIRLSFVLLFLFLLAYLNTSIYDFPEPTPFSGNKLYNPYEGLDSNNWKIANFHAHGYAWYGLSNGKGSNADLYHSYLKRLGYDALGISNYQRIDKNCNRKSEIRAYEHGYSPTKNHQIVIGSGTVCWKEYPLFQFLNHKQDVLRVLRENSDSNSLIAIAHPKRGKAYSREDMKYLTHYDCVEAFNHLSTSKEHWDAALSAGHPVNLLASDDSHDHEYIYHVARNATVINTEEVNEANIIQSIRSGKAFGVQIGLKWPVDFVRRRHKLDSLEHIRSFEVNNGLLTVQLSDTCDTILFVGQDGLVKKMVQNLTGASYQFTPEDTYIRAEVHFKKSHNYFYFNPVFRYDGERPVKKFAVENRFKTIIYRIFITICMLTLTFFYIRWERKKRLKPTPH